MFVRFFYHDDNSTGHDVQTLRLLSEDEHNIDLNQDITQIESALTSLLHDTRNRFPDLQYQLFAVQGIGDKAESIIGAEVLTDNPHQKSHMRYLVYPVNRAIADAIATPKNR